MLVPSDDVTVTLTPGLVDSAVQALRSSELDLADWDSEVLEEIVKTVLVTAGLAPADDIRSELADANRKLAAVRKALGADE